MLVVMAMMLQLLKLCIIGFFVAVQGSKGLVISLSPSPSPPNLPVFPSPSETPGPLLPRDSSTAIAPSSPEVPNGSFLHPPIALPLPALAPTPQKHKDIDPSTPPSPSTITLSPPNDVAPSPSTVQGNVPPPLKASPPQREEPTKSPTISTQTAPAPVAIPSGGSVNNSPVSQPTENGTLVPNIDNRNASQSHTAEPVSPSPVATPSTNSPKNSSGSQPTEHGSLPPKEGTDKGHSAEPITPAPVALDLPKISPVSQPNEHGSLPPISHQGNGNTSHNSKPLSPESAASPPWKVENNPSVVHPIFPTITPPILPAPVTSPTSSFPANTPLVHPIVPSLSPSKLPEPGASPMSTPSRNFHWKKGGAPPVAAPLYKTPKPLPAVIHPPAQAPAAHKAKQSVHAPEPLMSPKSPSDKESHSPALSPSSSSYKHPHTGNTIASPSPALPDTVSPPTSRHQDQAIPPSLPPASGQRHNDPPPMNQGSSVPPFSSPIDSPMGKVLPAPSPSVKITPHPPETQVPFFPPKASPSGPKTPLLPQVQALPPPPPNEECLSIVCVEPYTNSPPGAPCRCVWPMRVGLRLSVSLYTFFPFVSELASEIATGVFMKKSQVRIMGANAADEQPDKTVVLIDLVPLGENFDSTTAFFTSDRFWHKKVVIKASYFGDYDVLYVSYPGLPPSPPLPPSTITVIDGGPYSIGGNNGGTIKPLGVDIQKRQHKGGLSRGIIAIIAVSAFLAIVLCAAAALVLFKFRDHVSQPASTPRLSQLSLTKAPGTAGSSLIGGGVGSASTSFRSSIAAYKGSAKTFSANEIEKATDNFDASRILGEGGFGLVYSGILEDGNKVAVKVLKREDHHGNREFLAEVEMLSRLHHRNLVKLIGICAEESFRCLVYELIPNGSVESHLHGVDRENNPLDWGARMKIALGAARGLAYLHEDSSPRVIHRDFKSSNILLEDDFTPKVSDFGLARTATDEDNRHISTRVMGTFGYVAPEYAMTGHLLVKSDVYSYGVVLLELLTGRKPVDMSQPPGQENLVSWARPLLTSKEGLEAIIDPSLGSYVPFDNVAKVAAIASMCVQPEVSNRPFMGEVVQALKLVCNECDEAKEAGSRNSTQEELSVDLDVGVSVVYGELSDNIGSQFSATNFDSGVDVERGLSASELFSSSARLGRQDSGSFRRHSYSGPLRTGRSRQLWQIMRRLSGGTVSEHETMFKL